MPSLDLSILAESVEIVTLPKLRTRKDRDTPITERRMIAWDGEGMKLSGNESPQHYVMFGCSADVDGVLIGKNLGTMEILEYIIKIGEANPNAVHVGYGFRYDVNMIIKGLPPQYLRQIKVRNECAFNLNGYRWRIAYIPGKTFRVTKRENTRRNGKRSGDGYVSVKIDDMSSFFARTFLDACESILQDVMTDEDREIIDHGKQARKDNLWEDLPEVDRYWRAEIKLMEQMAYTFRKVMYDAGIMLREWYGPGAIATYLISKQGLRDHIQNEPGIPAVHEASKRAYAGGRFELFRVGRIAEPVYGYDINSAYPAALASAPSLGMEHGEWVYVENPTVIEEFGVYRITYNHGGRANPIEFNAMPLFHRDSHGSISFPQFCNGWYWSPEAANVAALARRYPGSAVIHEGWVWRHDNTRPFAFLQEMFDERIRLGKSNVVSMPYKLGPNSMYGKLAQRVGWDKEKRLPPKSHCLPLAGWVTSNCRAQLFRVMAQMPLDKLIAVETDGIYTTQPPEALSMAFGDKLGEWEVERYDEMLYLQNGVYHRRVGNNWLNPKARGLDIASVAQPVVEEYFRGCVPGAFDPLTVQMRERFIGLNAAFVRGKEQRVHDYLGRWEAGSREMLPGGSGKRTHIPGVCRTCIAGDTAWDTAHPLAIRTNAWGEMSTPHHLPWEDAPIPRDVAAFREMDLVAEDLIVRD